MDILYRSHTHIRKLRVIATIIIIIIIIIIILESLIRQSHLAQALCVEGLTMRYTHTE